MRTENVAALRQALPEALPWTTFLPAEDIDTLLSELVDTARGAVALDNLAPIALLLTQWRHSAEIYADPALLAILTREPDGVRRHSTPSGETAGRGFNQQFVYGLAERELELTQPAGQLDSSLLACEDSGHVRPSQGWCGI
ncbi:hypothetical protein ACWDYJ_25025 [Streptomyces sp. NPDC003042]